MYEFVYGFCLEMFGRMDFSMKIMYEWEICLGAKNLT